MKIQRKDEYPDEIRTLVDDYNKAVDARDITEVDLAVTGMITIVFSPNKELRSTVIDALKQIGDVQPGFLKNAVRVLISRYKGGGEKAEFASIAIGTIILGTKAKPLLTDPDLIAKITEEEDARNASKRAEKQIEEQFLEKVQTVGASLEGLVGSVFQAGNYYNKSLVDDDFPAATDAVKKLIDDTITHYPENFIQACLLLGRIGNENNRKEFFKKNLNYLLEKTRSKKKEERPVAEEILETIINDVADLLPPDVAGKIQADAARKGEERKKAGKEKAEREKKISKASVEVDFKWDTAVRELANQYNESVAANNDKAVNTAIGLLDKFLSDKSDKIRESAAQFLRQLLLKNREKVIKIMDRLLKSCRKPECSEILGEMLDVIEEQQMLVPETLAQLSEDKRVRDEEREKQREEDQKQFEEIEKVSIKFDAAWEPQIVEICEAFNDDMLNQKEKDGQRLVGELEKYMYAEDKEIRKQAATSIKNVSEKYPDYVTTALKKLLDLFNSEHELREISSEDLAIIIQSSNKDVIFADVPQDTFDKITAENEERMKKHEDQMLQDKWQAIRMDVVPVRINEKWNKNIQALVRRYNEDIKNQDKEKVQAEVKTVVNGVMNERKEETLTQWIEVLGGIAEKNIELIAPTITLLLQWADEKDTNKKFRAIQGLGEVGVARPGWAYQAIEKLFKIVESDENAQGRYKAFTEISRIAKKEMSMVVEYVPSVISALKDSDKQIRRLAAWTLGQMAEVIPLEAKEAIPALTEALHDEYPLVRTFADKALNLIRKAMREEKTEDQQ